MNKKEWKNKDKKHWYSKWINQSCHKRRRKKQEFASDIKRFQWMFFVIVYKWFNMSFDKSVKVGVSEKRECQNKMSSGIKLPWWSAEKELSWSQIVLT